jgi:N-carbamoylputrescine amidase
MIMNKPITIGIIQSKILNNTQSNLEKALNMAEEAAKKGAKIICLPELFLSPYFCQGPKDKKNFNLAENLESGYSTIGIFANSSLICL